MTRIFTEDGTSIPVTVIEVDPNRVTQVKTGARDGYTAVQVTTGARKAQRVTKALAGHYAKAGSVAGRGMWEFRIDAKAAAELAPGATLGVHQFEAGQKV